MRVRLRDVSLYIDVDGCGLVPEGESMADRPTLILLHGGPGADHSLFKPEFAALTDIAQIVYVDQRGSGRSDVSRPEAWTWDQWADDIADLAEALDIRRPVLVGTSSGALVAMACAARYPELVAGLVLDSPLGVPTTLDETLDVFERRGGPTARAAAERYLGGDTSEEAAAAWREYGLPLYSTDQRGMAEKISRVRMNDEVQAHFRQGGCGPTDGYEPDVPVLILVGENDPVVPTAAARRLAANLRQARALVLDGVGHGVFRQAPEQAFPAVRDFLSQAIG